MNIDFDFDLFFSLFDLAIVGLLGWAAWLGYKKGAIVQAIALFALVVGLGISAITTKFIYAFFTNNGSKAPELFSALWLGGLFGGAIYGADRIRKLVQKRTSDLKSDKNDKYIGIGLSIVKMFLIISLYSFVIINIDYYGHFLPKSEKRSRLTNMSAKVIPAAFKFLRWETTTKKNNDNSNYQPYENLEDIYEDVNNNSYPDEFNDEGF